MNSVDLYLLQASALIAANQPHFAAVVDRRDRQTDGRTVSRPAAYYVGSSVNSSVFDLVLCLQLMHAVCGRRMMIIVDFCHDMHSEYKCLFDDGVDICLIYEAWL